MSSFWGPYIASLPALPPNPWLLSDADLDVALQQLDGTLASTAALESAADLQAQQGSSADEGHAAGSQYGVEGAPLAAHWRAAVVRARQHYAGLADEVLEVLGAGEEAGADVAAALGVDKEGLMWALGMVRRCTVHAHVHAHVQRPLGRFGGRPLRLERMMVQRQTLAYATAGRPRCDRAMCHGRTGRAREELTHVCTPQATV